MVGSKETASSGHNKFDNTYGFTVTVAAHRRPTQVQPRQNPATKQGKWTQNPTPKQEALCNWYPLGEGKISYVLLCFFFFSSRLSLGMLSTFCDRNYVQG